MKKIPLLLTATALFSTAHAQTNFISGNTNVETNWSNGLPTSIGNPGTIAANGSLQAMDGYFVTQTAGTMNLTGSRIISNGTYEMTGGFMTTGSNGLTFSGTQILTVDGGSITGTGAFGVNSGAQFNFESGIVTMGNASNRDIAFHGGTVLMTGGALTSGRDILMGNVGGSLTMSGGTINATRFGSVVGTNDGGVVMNLNGGTIIASGDFGLFTDTTINTVTFGGSTAGSITAANLTGDLGDYILNWTTGTLMTMNITGSANWAETVYNAGFLRFNGDNNSTLGLTWTEATSGGTQIWDYTGTTLSVIPEPSSIALMGIALLSLLGLNRRNG